MQQFSEKSNISRPKELKVKAYIWILSLIDGHKPVCRHFAPFISRLVSSYMAVLQLERAFLQLGQQMHT